ncbi:MAG: hypothetical protein AAF594_02270 [Bacteroidota bacterium]
MGRALRLGAWLGAAAVVGGLAWLAGDGLDDAGRDRLVRYLGILISATIAIAAPHVLYPDPRARALQLSNPAPRRLLRYLLGRWMPLPAVLAVPALVIALGTGAPRWALALEGAGAVLALSLYAFARTAPIGPRVLAWERLEAGGWYRALYTWSPPIRFLVPDPYVPQLLLTGEVFLLGGIVAIAGQGGGTGAGLVASGVLAGLAVVLLLRQAGAFDRAFWTTHGVWADAFRPGAGPASGREPIAYGSIYWAPGAIRPSVWAGLRSLDRRLPLGRVAVGLLAIVVAVHAMEAPAGVRLAALGLYVVGMNAAVALTASEAVLPGAFAVRLGGVARWTAARALMNLRWLPPLAITLALLAWVTEVVSLADVAVWSGIDLAVAVLTAILVTVLSHVRTRRAVA